MTVDARVLWIVLAVYLFLLTFDTLFFIVILVLKSRPKRAKKKAGQNSVTVGKLHCIGDRPSQQDCFAVSPEEMYRTNGMLAVVADGMGGLADGDKVSQAAVTSMVNNFLSYEGGKENLLLSLTETANRSVNTMLGAGNIGKGGSTLTAGLFYQNMFYYLSIGDSRICMLRDGQLIQLNREHIYLNDLSVEAVNGIGTVEAAATNPQKGGVTSYLGMGTLKYIDIPAEPISMRPGDTFVLMSDGVYNALSHGELRSALALSPDKAVALLEQMIREKAYKNQDNYTAVVVRYN